MRFAIGALKLGFRAAAGAGKLAIRAGGASYRASPRATIYGAGLLAGAGVMASAGALTAYSAYKNYVSLQEADFMAKAILNAQMGPFGPSAAALGIGPNLNNHAGVALASHYAANRNKKLGVLGLRYL